MSIAYQPETGQSEHKTESDSASKPQTLQNRFKEMWMNRLQGLTAEELLHELVFSESQLDSRERVINDYIQREQWWKRLMKSKDLISTEKLLIRYYLSEIGQVDVRVTLIMGQVADDLGVSTDSLRSTNRKLQDMGAIIYDTSTKDKRIGPNGKIDYYTQVYITLQPLVLLPEQIKKRSEKAGGDRKRVCKSCKTDNIDRYAVEYCRSCQDSHVMALPGLRGDANVWDMISSVNLPDKTHIDPRLNEYAMSEVDEQLSALGDEVQKHNALDVAALDSELESISQPQLPANDPTPPPEIPQPRHDQPASSLPTQAEQPPLEQKHNASSNPHPTVYHFGYTEPNALEILDQIMATAHNPVVIDTRLKPVSKIPQWTADALEERYGESYKPAGHVLGNRNYKSGPVDIVDLPRGIKGLQRYLDLGDDIVLLCKCNHDQCHRYTILEALWNAEPSIPLLHITKSAKPSVEQAVSVVQVAGQGKTQKHYASKQPAKPLQAESNAGTNSIRKGDCIPHSAVCQCKKQPVWISGEYCDKQDGVWRCKKCCQLAHWYGEK